MDDLALNHGVEGELKTQGQGRLLLVAGQVDLGPVVSPCIDSHKNETTNVASFMEDNIAFSFFMSLQDSRTS